MTDISLTTIGFDYLKYYATFLQVPKIGKGPAKSIQGACIFFDFIFIVYFPIETWLVKCRATLLYSNRIYIK